MKLSHYEWDPEKDLVAEGGFAEVFKARDLHAANRWVALKIYKEAVSRGTGGSTGQKKYSLEQEFARIDGLSHTNIVSYYGLEYLQHQDHVGRTSNYPILIMEYAGEGTLSELMQKSITPEETLRIVRGVIEAMAYLHDQGIIHRDLKPGNILFTKDRNGRLVPKVTDFGISRDILGEKTIEQSFTEGVGTPHYMAPEQFFKKKFGLQEAVSERTDLWAIGVILYRMLTGELPFGHGQKDYELIRDEIVEKAPDISKIPDNFKGLIKACLQKKAVDRAASAQELLMHLEPERTMTMAQSSGVQQDIGGTQVMTTGSGRSREGHSDKPAPTSKKSGKLIWTVMLSLVIILAAGIGGFSWYRHAKVQDLLNSAEAHYLSGEFKEAYEIYLKASEYSSGRAYYYLSLMNEMGNGTDINYDKAQLFADQAIAQDYQMAAFQYGWLHLSGLDTPIDTLKALEYFEDAIDHIQELSDENDPEAQNLLGILYYYGYVVDQDWELSYDITKRAAESGHPAAMANLAYRYRMGHGTEKDCEQAIYWYNQGTQINHDRGYLGLGSLYYSGCDSLQLDYGQALKNYQAAADLGNIEAKHMVGVIYHYGRGVDVDYDEALIWYRDAAEGSNVRSMNSAGLIYKLKKNYSNARDWFLKAALRNDQYGAYNLAQIYGDQSTGFLNQDSSANWYEKAAIWGHTTAAVYLGHKFFNGTGRPQNYDSSFHWYHWSALQGNSLGQYYTGDGYENGRGRNVNTDSAVYWYQKSSDQGSAYGHQGLAGIHFKNKELDKALTLYLLAAEQDLTYSQYMVGHIYHSRHEYEKAKTNYLKAAAKGHAVSQLELGKIYEYQGSNYLAFNWYQKGADNGDAEAQRRLGLCHYKGIGTPKNKSKARYWLNLSCQNNNQKACSDLNTLL